MFRISLAALVMEWTRLVCCLPLFLACVGASAAETLHNIEDLKNKAFGHQYPRHGLFLLHWLANHISIQPEEIRLQFDPARQDYGFRYYESTLSNSSALPHLDELSDRKYYSVGSLSSEPVRTKLPPYVTLDYYNAYTDSRRDLDRVVVRVYRTNPSLADKVYITQAGRNEQEGELDPDETFEIGFKLLMQIQRLKTPLNLVQTLEQHLTDAENSDDPRLALSKDKLIHHLKHSDQRLLTIYEDPGLRWLLTLAGYDIANRYDVHKRTWSCSSDGSTQPEQTSRNPETLCEGQHPVKIEVKSTANGYARILWSGLPRNIINTNVTLVLFSSDTSNELERFTEIRGRTSGTYDTYLALNNGIHPRLVLYNFVSEHGFIGIRYSVVWRGPQFDETSRTIPTKVTGFGASLQLFTQGGYACARLYVKKSFTRWDYEFGNSWVSFYSSDQDPDTKHQHYQWVISFDKAGETEDYLIYEYRSPVSIGPGVQARFVYNQYNIALRVFQMWFSGKVKARTVPWESAEN